MKNAMDESIGVIRCFSGLFKRRIPANDVFNVVLFKSDYVKPTFSSAPFYTGGVVGIHFSIMLILRSISSSEVSPKIMEWFIVFMINHGGFSSENIPMEIYQTAVLFPKNVPSVWMERPVEFAQFGYHFTVHQSKRTLGARNVSDRWANYGDSLTFCFMLVRHRFAPLKQFASWVLQALTATMPPLYQGAC